MSGGWQSIVKESHPTLPILELNRLSSPSAASCLPHFIAVSPVRSQLTLQPPKKQPPHIPPKDVIGISLNSVEMASLCMFFVTRRENDRD